jgi:hypothetical protein
MDRSDPEASRDTIPAPAPIPEEAPPWAVYLIGEVRELKAALVENGDLVIQHTAEMRGLATQCNRLELAILTLEGRAHVTERRLEPLEGVVLPILKEAANG